MESVGCWVMYVRDESVWSCTAPCVMGCRAGAGCWAGLVHSCRLTPPRPQAFRFVDFTVPEASSPPPPPPLHPHDSAPPSAPPSTPPLPPLSPPPPMELLGCFFDKGADEADRAFANGSAAFRVGWQKKKAVTNCVERCSGLLGQRYMYMALTEGDLCYCADSYKRVSEAVGLCTSNIGFCELEYGCGGMGVLSIYNLSAHYTVNTDLPHSDPNFDGDACPGDRLPVVIDTYIAPFEASTLKKGEELIPGCNENTTSGIGFKCSLRSKNRMYTMTLGEDGALRIVDRYGTLKVQFGGNYRRARGPYRLRMYDDNILKIRGFYDTSPTGGYPEGLWSWLAGKERMLWESHGNNYDSSGYLIRTNTLKEHIKRLGDGQAEAVLNDQGGIEVVDAVGKVISTTCDRLYGASHCESGWTAKDDFVPDAAASSGGASSGPWPQTTSLLTPSDVVDARGHGTTLTDGGARDTCYFTGSWRVDGTLTPTHPTMNGCHRTFRQQVTSP